MLQMRFMTNLLDIPSQYARSEHAWQYLAVSIKDMGHIPPMSKPLNQKMLHDVRLEHVAATVIQEAGYKV